MIKVIILELLEKFLLYLIIIIIGLVRVRFLTLFERKLLSYIQIRKGPNKVGIIGIFQPFRDAIKLISKELFKLRKVRLGYFFICPVIILVIRIIIWICLNNLNYLNRINLRLLFILRCIRISVYFIIVSGWASNSIYSLIGSIRSVAQVISYEVRMIFILIRVVIIVERFSINYILKFQDLIFLIFIYPLSIIFFITILAELNRTPFDLIEGESELVSGFNVEYFRRGFTLIFLSEYINILFIRMLFVNLFIIIGRIEVYFIFVVLIIYIILCIRGVLPRIRYDELIRFCWLKILPFSINYLVFIRCIKFFIIM